MLEKLEITSRNNELVKWISSLKDKKGRRESGSFIAEGVKLTLEAISAGMPITHILVSKGEETRIVPLIEEALENVSRTDCRLYVLSESAFEKISTEKAPQGVITVIKYLDNFNYTDIIYKEEFFLKQSEKAIVLCSLRDPSNLGAVIRSAVAFGVDHIILTNDCADHYSPKTVRAAMGSLFKVKLTVISDLAQFIKSAQENHRRVYAAELSDNAVSLADLELCRTDLFVIGNEGHGIPEEISSLTDLSVYIPIAENVESLNASVAASVFLWELSKK
ncbi:MAG: RNA methyltransferase [Clostridia bacterium]|nr:RNA methyltransferase [Clostridia bacterium]